MKRHAEFAPSAFALGILLTLTPGEAAAYVGPGGGLSLLPMALGMLAAFSVSAFVVVTWPVRMVKRWLLRRRHTKGKVDGGTKQTAKEQ